MDRGSSHQLSYTFPMFSRSDESTPPIPVGPAPTTPGHVLPTPSDGMATIQKWISSLSRPNSSHTAEKIKRPPNVFLIYRTTFVSLNPGGKSAFQRDLSQVVGPIWKALPDHERKPWHELAEYAVQEHKKRYPGYRYQPSPSKSKGRGKKSSNKSIRGTASEALLRMSSSSALAASPPPLPLSSILPSRDLLAVETSQSFPPYPNQPTYPNGSFSHGPSLANPPIFSSHPGPHAPIMGNGMFSDLSSSFDPSLGRIHLDYDDPSPTMDPFLDLDMDMTRGIDWLDSLSMTHGDVGFPSAWSEHPLEWNCGQ